MEWLHKNKLPWKDDTFQVAAHLGNLESLRWLLEKKCPWSAATFENAAKHGDWRK